MINKSYMELLQGVYLVIKYKDDVLDYLYNPIKEMNGLRFSELFHANSSLDLKITMDRTPDFHSELKRQSDILQKRYDFFSDKTVIIEDWSKNSDGRATIMVKISPKSCSYWISLDGQKYVLLYSELFDAPDVDQKFYSYFKVYFDILNYYLLNPYLELPVSMSELKSRNTAQNPKLKPIKYVHLTSNHHKYRIRRGVNVLDTNTNELYVSIMQASKSYNVKYQYFYYDLCHGYYNNLKRIEKLKVDEDIAPILTESLKSGMHESILRDGRVADYISLM